MNAITPTVTFELNGRQVAALPHETLIEVAGREGIEIPRLCYKEGYEAVGNCRSCMVEIDGERVLAPSCCRHPSQGMKVTTDSPRARRLAKDGARTAAGRHAGSRVHAQERSRRLGRKARPRPVALPAHARPAAARRYPRRHHRQPRRLHPVHALRARLPRRAGERRDRPGLPRRERQDRVRPGRPDGGLDLRGLRRMRASLPDRRPDAGARGGARAFRTSRSIRSARIAASAAS